jgi:DNA-directed RNA polymerase subunit beta
MGTRPVKNFGKIGDAVPVPDLTKVQRDAYSSFLQLDIPAHKREDKGLEALFRESFPIKKSDDSMQLDYVKYELERPRFTPLECKELSLTYGHPLKITCRFTIKETGEVQEQSVYIGDIPIMRGGGTFIINGAERVIVNQLHRSPGIDFRIDSKEGDRILHGAKIVPERGSWIELSVTKKDAMIIKIDQSNKIPATTFLRAMDEKYGGTAEIIRLFYETQSVPVAELKPTMWAVGQVIDTETGEIIVDSGCQLGDSIAQIQAGELENLEVVTDTNDPIIFNTLAEDDASSHEQALVKIYSRLRPGNPLNTEKAKELFFEKFYDESRYRLGRVGRFRLNRKFHEDIDESLMTLEPRDFINTLRYIIDLRSNKGHVDDIDHLGNRRLRTIDELAADEIRKGLLKLRRTIEERMNIKEPDQIGKVSDIINSKAVSSSIEYFFGRGELSQVVDQTNILSQLTHERRLSALGPGGLNRKRAGFEVRDVHISHYGRICPIETPEGTNIGLIASLGIFSGIDDYGFLVTPYRKVKDSLITGEVEYLRADEEMELVFTPPSSVDPESGKLKDGLLLARERGELTQTTRDQVDFVDISPKQTVGVSASLIPFLEHDDANRALMGSNMMRQAVPLLTTEPPMVGTGMEEEVARNSSMVLKAVEDGVVTYVDAMKIVIDDRDEYELQKFRGLNERTCLNQQPLVRKGQQVKRGDIIADGGATRDGRLSLGKNVLVAFVPFDGYNFEDAILISENLVKDDAFTSVHIDSFTIEIRETKLGREEFTCDIPNVSERMLKNLDSRGIVREGTRVGPNDILVGKVSPKSKTELTPEEKLLHAIFGRAGEDVKNDSLVMPSGHEGVVIETKHFKRKTSLSSDERAEQERKLDEYKESMYKRQIRIFKQMIKTINDKLGIVIVDPTSKQKVGTSEYDEVILEQIETFTLDWVEDENDRKKVKENVDIYWPRIQEVQFEMERYVDSVKRGDELPSGVLEMVKVYIATKRPLSVGDKMAGRHGNKGVIARVMPQEDMPFLEDGTPCEIVLNPLGVPSRMNVGQILETHLGWAAKVLGFDAITSVFDGASESDVSRVINEVNEHVIRRKQELEESKAAPDPKEIYATVPDTLKTQLYDGRTGEPFEQRATVGYMYMLKLHHLVDEKIHARSTGPYSLITQQPLGGKARAGGQRFGEMEVWALEAYGAAYTLQELLTVKSDDMEGRSKIYESMVKGANTLEAGTPISFDVLCSEVKGLGLNISLEKNNQGNGPI